MESTLNQIFSECQSDQVIIYERALSDLRFVIERHTMNRFDDSEREDYLKLFFDQKLIDYKIDEQDFEIAKKVLIFLLFNFPDRSVLVAKCIKVLFDHTLEEAICHGIEVYMKKSDLTTCELLYAIVNSYDNQEYLNNDRISSLFQEIAKNGGQYSKEIIEEELKLLHKHSSH